jgi:excisionase family DNA binding protein
MRGMMKVGDVEVLTLKEAGERLGISHVTLRLQAKKGVFGATLAGHQWLVTSDEVERYRRENLGKRGNYDHKTAARKPREGRAE